MALTSHVKPFDVPQGVPLHPTPEGFLTIDQDGIIQAFSHGAERLCGYSITEVLGRRITCLLDHQSQGDSWGEIALFLENRNQWVKGFSLAVSGQHKDGSTVPLGMTINTLLVGHVWHIMVVIRSLAQFRPAQHFTGISSYLTTFSSEFLTGACTLSHALEVVCDLLPIEGGAVWYVGPQHPVMRIGESWEQTSVMQQQMFTHRQALQVVPGIGVVGQAWEYETSLWVADVVGSPTFPSNLPPFKYGAYAFPVKFQNSVIAVIEFFGHKIQAPTTELLTVLEIFCCQIGGLIVRHYFEPRKMKEMTTQSNRMVAQHLAHDVNNILTVLKGYAELSVVNVESSTLVTGYLKEILHAIRRGEHLTNQILKSPPQQESHEEAVSLRSVVDEVLNFLRETVPLCIEIREPSRPPHGWIAGNSGQIHQMVMNLCFNAVQAMQNKVGMLEVTLHEIEIGEGDSQELPELTQGHWVRLVVRDTGIGIPQEIGDQIFAPYFTTKGHEGGTGLGLAYIQKTILSHQGVLQWKSIPGQGTAFSVYLPRFTVDVDRRLDL